MDNLARKKLGSNIKQLRTKLELSQEQLAEKADLHRTYVGAVERGERNISLDNILAIARALGISASELLEGVE
ncbi:helix-turn-helix domain-containing protein [Dolichospermum circinale]|uniref:helix-turn-helix domain-containing protein n=1 Tax=Dolichospermum circinale TaxID=109265 RepID=UPI0023303FB3|nr:helix-turn-helix transcriptional regulator [Dolichospermum circinale]MDB9452634.1 helix-turn-helix transcriptional regulator [Dolichospermum circinale CS-547]